MTQQSSQTPFLRSLNGKQSRHRYGRWVLTLGSIILTTMFVSLLLLFLRPPKALYAGGLAFTEFRTFGTGADGTVSLAIADLDTDGDLDIVSGNHLQNSISFNDGNGYFDTTVNFGTGNDFTQSVAVGDIDGDGDIDIVVGNYQQQNSVYLNDGRGNFNTHINFGTINNTNAVAIGDMNGDGSLDIIVGNYGEQNAIYLNDGSGHFGTAYYFAPSYKTQDIITRDIEGDGDLDIVVGNYGEQNVVYLNNGIGYFSIAVNFGTGVDKTQSIEVEDIDNDGDLDIAVGNSPGQNAVYLNNGSGNFDDFVSFGIETRTTDLVIADIDRDSDFDIVVGGGNGPMPNVVYLNDGSNHFDTTVSFGTSTNTTSSLAIGDVNGDNSLDIIVGNLNQQNFVCLNDDSIVLNAGVSFETGIYGTHGPAIGDMNGDKSLDLVVNNDGQNTLVTNDGSGHFDTSIHFGTGIDSVLDIALGDFDKDSDLDVITVGGPQKTIYLNDGHGHFDTGIDLGPTGSNTWSVAVGDMNGDNNLDIVIGNRAQENIIYLNDGYAHFNTTRSFGIGGDFLTSVTVGDLDADGDLDIITGGMLQQTSIYLNDGNGNFENNIDFGAGNVLNNDIATADVDGDSDLDLVLGNKWQQNIIYLNDGNGNFEIGSRFGSLGGSTESISIGDLDGDGDLDIVAGERLQQNSVYRNDGNGHFEIDINFGSTFNSTIKVSTGDMDGDGDLDIVACTIPQSIVFFNQANSFNNLRVARPSPPSNANYYSSPFIMNTSVLTIPYTIFQSAGSPMGSVKVYYSFNGGGAWQVAIPTAETITHTLYGKTLEFDGQDDWIEGPDFDLGNSFTLSLWINPTTNVDGQFFVGKHSLTGDDLLGIGFADNGYQFNLHGFTYTIGSKTTGWQYFTVTAQDNGDNTTIVSLYKNAHLLGQQILNTVVGDLSGQGWAFGQDWDGNSRTDFFRGQIAEVRLWNSIRTQQQIQTDMKVQLPSNMPGLVAYWPMNEGNGNTVLDKSPNGYNAVLGAGNPSEQPDWVSGGVFSQQIFYWDVFHSGFFGRSDNVVLRFIAHPWTFHTGITGTYQYTNSVPGPFLYPNISATTFPFRVRGTQVRVVDETGLPISGANVYRLPAGANLANVISSPNSGVPYITDGQGYLQGFGRLDSGDELIALYPIAATQHYTVYYTSAPPTEAGMGSYTIHSSGVQTLTASSENVLILFNLIVSLEWDARNDPSFITQLENDFRRASQILFDVTDGQAALGDIRIYHDRGYWGHADIIIRANNTVRPASALGGIVTVPTTYTVSASQVITNAYLPGQIAMPPQWNRYGEPNGTIGEDWPRTLVHELGHYAFFVPDNYLGLTPEGRLTVVDCAGSLMTDPYPVGNSEFLAQHDWIGACLRTLAELYTGRTDWERILEAYPELDAPIEATDELAGPNSLPLAVTHIEVLAPITPTTTLADPFFSLVDGNGQPISLTGGQAQVYLFKTNATADPTDDYVLPLGTPVGNVVQARGVSPGDRLCVYDFSQTTPQIGCVNNVGNYPESIPMIPVPNWNPSLFVSAVTTNTLTITVTNSWNESALMVQVLPALGAASPVVAMISNNGIFTQTVTAPDGAYYGFIRIWSPTNPEKEMLFEYVTVDWGGKALAWGNLLNPWGGKALAWGGKALAWGGKALAWGGKALAWGAPVMSTDGQVSIFPLDNLFGENLQDITLQRLVTPPSLYPWLVPVGQAYRIEVNGPVPNSDILFRYLANDVPSGYEFEENLAIYYSPDEGATWIKLPIVFNHVINHASAQVQGEGIYVLAVAEGVWNLDQGWDSFHYDVHATRLVTDALISINGLYTAVANYDQNRPDQWLTYYVTVTVPFAPLVNNLHELEYYRDYWIYATEPIALYLRPDNFGNSNNLNGSEFPPATFYGWITPTLEFPATVGTSVTAWIDGTLCGQTTVEAFPNNQLYYVIQVLAENLYGGSNGCGQEGDTVVFKVDDVLMDHDHPWDNHLAWFHPLTTIADLISPTLTVPQTITVEATGPAGAVVTYIVTAVDNRDLNPIVICSPISGSTFPLGVTVVSCTATDASGNSATDSFEVHVVDTTPPTLAVPNDMIIEATSPAGAPVAYTTTVTDTVDPNPTVSCNPTSGSTFPLGLTQVPCIASDFSGNSVTQTFTITVEDTTPPVLTVPTTITVEATGPSGAIATYTVIALDIVDVNPIVQCSPLSGSTFTLGDTIVHCVATDASGNSTSDSFVVSVVDTIPPILSLPPDIMVATSNPQGVSVTYVVTATDIVDPNPLTTCIPASGNIFPIGTTTVSCIATDGSGNQTPGTFTVTVNQFYRVFMPIIRNPQSQTTQINPPKTVLTPKVLNPVRSSRLFGKPDITSGSLAKIIPATQELNYQNGRGIGLHSVPLQYSDPISKPNSKVIGKMEMLLPIQRVKERGCDKET